MLRYYLGSGLRFATTLGPVADTQVFDWRDAVDRLRGGAARSRRSTGCSRRCLAAASSSSSRRSSATTAPGRRPGRASSGGRRSSGTRLLAHDPRLRVEHHIVTDEIAVKRNYFKPLQAVVYRRIG